jgi:hypothetical protein
MPNKDKKKGTRKLKNFASDLFHTKDGDEGEKKYFLLHLLTFVRKRERREREKPRSPKPKKDTGCEATRFTSFEP